MTETGTRGALYQGLAEALAHPPAWLALAGREWPLRQAAANCAAASSAADAAVRALDAIPAGSMSDREAGYRGLFAGRARPRFWLYESMYRSGRLVGNEKLALSKVYAAAGLEPAGGELPDHASVELAFLAFLAERQEQLPEAAPRWRRLERHFIQRHAGRWLPELGRALARSGNEVYGPIGYFLAAWLEETLRRTRQPAHSARVRSFPRLATAGSCTLCGFCIQVCMPRALHIRETVQVTELLLAPERCTGCRQCERICPAKAIHLQPDAPSLPDVLFQSPRRHCPACSQPTVSEAEYAFVISRIGFQEWMPYCLPCRAALLETST